MAQPNHFRRKTGDAGMSRGEDELGRLAKRRIEAGELPCYRVTRIWGSHGSGARCSLCDLPIRADEIEYEISLESGADEHSLSLRFHLACHAVWQAECIRAVQPAAGP